MENVATAIEKEIAAGYHHCFVLTQNIRDYIWEDMDPQPFSFPVALCRRLSKSGDGTLVAYYSLCKGIRLYYKGDSTRDEDLENEFRLRTGLGQLLNAEVIRPDDLPSIIQPPDVVLPRLTGLLATCDRCRCTLVIDSADNMVSSRGGGGALCDRAVVETMENWSWDSRIRSRKNSVVLLCSERSRIPEGIVRVDGGYVVLPVQYPTTRERVDFLSRRKVEQEAAAILANQTTGFRRIDVEEILTRRLNEKEISQKKAEIIRNRCGDSLELVESSFGLEMANAQPHVREYLVTLKEVILTNRKDAAIPNGLLFVGVPGNGKSHITKAFAHDCGMNMLRFKNVRNSFVGESDRNLNNILDILPALAPCVVFIDEIDQVIHSRSRGGGEHDGGVESRMLARLLEFMGDSSHRGDIIWIGATNRPDLLDPAMPRRLGRVFPFMNPTGEARKGLIEDLVRRLELPFDENFDYPSAAALMKDYSCDDVEKVVVRSREVAHRSESRRVFNSHIQTTCRSFKHNYNPTMYEFIGLLSIEICNFLSDLPWCDDEGRVRDKADLPWFLEHMIDGDRINMNRISDRLNGLRTALGYHV